MSHIYTGLDIGNGNIKIVVVNASDSSENGNENN